MSNPNPTQTFALNVWAEGVVTSTNGEPVPGEPSIAPLDGQKESTP